MMRNMLIVLFSLHPTCVNYDAHDGRIRMPILHLWEGFEAHKFYETSLPLSKKKHANTLRNFLQCVM
jgi:hypothetical protein